jgi:hypothetical protein
MTMKVTAKARARAQAALTKAYDNWTSALAKGFSAAAAGAWAAYLSAWNAARKADSEFNVAAQDYWKCLGITGGAMKLKKKRASK